MHLRTPLSRAKGLGSAKEGIGHWWMQRVSSLFLIPLIVWGALMIASLGDYSHRNFTNWLSEPVNAILMMLLLVTGCYHAALGLQVVVEDYVHKVSLKLMSIIMIYFSLFILTVVGVFAVVEIAF
ncbi:MAG: succinate dehydrogenase, hydrophobic membrane anchor protein [Chromatiales bacterium]|nr:succinate dehydrogenase, hydrophobic membrane anchor protein [Chromatiales bacterium]